MIPSARELASLDKSTSQSRILSKFSSLRTATTEASNMRIIGLSRTYSGEVNLIQNTGDFLFKAFPKVDFLLQRIFVASLQRRGHFQYKLDTTHPQHKSRSQIIQQSR